MEDLPKDVLFQISLKLNLPDILRLCATNKRINSLVGERDDIWYAKLNMDFSGYQMLKPNPKDNYRLLYELTILKEKLKIEKDIYELYDLQWLDLSCREIKEIPKEIRNLTNLNCLSFVINQIKEFPKEMGNLTNLKYLYLSSNRIRELPKEIAKLINLESLYIYNNPIRDIPKEITELINLNIYKSENI